jgi:hypothetical protein
MVTAVLATAGTACAPESRSVHEPTSFVWCGTTLYTGVGALSPSRLHPVSGRPGGQVPSRSVLPPAAASRPPGGRVELVITGDCGTAPVVTVRPAGAARTLVVAHGANGGVAGLALATLGQTITVRAYQGGRLVRELPMPEGAAPAGLP